MTQKSSSGYKTGRRLNCLGITIDSILANITRIGEARGSPILKSYRQIELTTSALTDVFVCLDLTFLFFNGIISTRRAFPISSEK